MLFRSLWQDSGSKAVGEVDGSIVAYDLEEALNLPKEFDREMYDLISVLSK